MTAGELHATALELRTAADQDAEIAELEDRLLSAMTEFLSAKARTSLAYDAWVEAQERENTAWHATREPRRLLQEARKA